MKVMGISGSPIPNSNTDRAVKAVLDATGLVSRQTAVSLKTMVSLWLKRLRRLMRLL
jgi:hypothetical protein